jgi:hypothetical protein
MKRSTARVLSMAGVRAHGSVTDTISGVAADLVAELARDTWTAGAEFAHWPFVGVEYLREGGFDDDGGIRLEPTTPAAAQFVRVHAAVETQ